MQISFILLLLSAALSAPSLLQTTGETIDRNARAIFDATKNAFKPESLKATGAKVGSVAVDSLKTVGRITLKSTKVVGGAFLAGGGFVGGLVAGDAVFAKRKPAPVPGQ